MEPSARREFLPLYLGLGALLVLGLFLRSGLLLIIFLLLGLAGITSALWSRYALERLEYQRRFSRDRVFVGEEVELTISVTNRKVLPVTYLVIEDMVPDELHIGARRLSFARVGKGTLRLLFGLAWYQKVIRHYRVTPVRRGFYTLGPASIRGGDPFGYVQREREVAEKESLIVYPRVVPLEQLGIPSRRPFGDLRSKDRLFEDPMRFAGVREYQPGDPLNRVHWKASAASGHLQVRLLDPSSNLGLAVFLNTWGYDVFWQGNDPTALEAGCTVAASIAQWATEQDLALGLYANGLAEGWGMRLELPPARGPEVLTHALEGLARIGMPGRESIADMLLGEAPGLGYGSSVVVITRLVSEELAAAMLKVHRSGRPVTLVLVGEAKQPEYSLGSIRVYAVPGEEALHAAVLA